MDDKYLSNCLCCRTVGHLWICKGVKIVDLHSLNYSNLTEHITLCAPLLIVKAGAQYDTGIRMSVISFGLMLEGNRFLFRC